MILVYAFYPGDQDLALKNAKWIEELGSCKGHEVLMIFDTRCNDETIGFTTKELSISFAKVHTLEAKAEIIGWPEGANYFFRLATSWLEQRTQHYKYFFWMEPDAIPLKEGWLDAIQDEFEDIAVPMGKRFMGDRVEVENVPLHMSGVGVYPNPLHAFAGEAYRAHDLAWDMAAREQIVPKANFTKLIEHAWRHPEFKDQSELQTQIRPEAVIFHSSKDGSLIDLLQRKRSAPVLENIEERGGVLVPIDPSKPWSVTTNLTAVPVLAEPVAALRGTKEGSARESTQPTDTEQTRKGEQTSDSRGGGQDFTCDIFIRTYSGDSAWLNYCLQSIKKFCSGFRKVVITSPDIPMNITGEDFEWIKINDEAEDGYLSQQITKLYADVFLDYQPDYILHVDSDNVFQKPCSPWDFFPTKYDPGKPIWYYTPYSNTETPWQPITEKFMQDKVEHEFMRRHPILVPRWLYSKFREFAYKKHGMIISQYIRNQPLREFSEFNALGAFAWKFHREKFHWVNTLEVSMPEPFVKQYHSWGGVTDEVKAEIEQILSGQRIEARTGQSTSSLERKEPSAGLVSKGANPLVYADAQNIPTKSPGVDVADSVFTPVSTEPVKRVEVSDVSSAPPPVSTFPVNAGIILTADNLKEYVRVLAQFSKLSRGNSIRVGQQLSRAGLK